MPSFYELSGPVFNALCRLNGRMRHYVVGFPGFHIDDLRSYANEITWKLTEGRCDCGRPPAVCKRRHSLAGWDKNISLKRFVDCAVQGDRGLPKIGLYANSVMGGMMGRNLREDWKIFAHDIVWKECANPECFDMVVPVVVGTDPGDELLSDRVKAVGTGADDTDETLGGGNLFYEGGRCPNCGALLDPRAPWQECPNCAISDEAALTDTAIKEEPHGERKPVFYEGGSCPNPNCGAPFNPSTTWLVKQCRLVIEGVYVPMPYYRCDGGGREHFHSPIKCLPEQRDHGRVAIEKIVAILYQAEKGKTTIQSICREHGITETTFYRWRKAYGGMDVAEASRQLEKENERRYTYHVVHGKNTDGNEVHDYCPLEQCPNGKPRHPQNPTTLWTRQQSVGPLHQSKGIPPLMRSALLAAILAALGIAPISAPRDEDLGTLCEWFARLFNSAKITPGWRKELREVFDRIFAEYGIDEMDIHNYFYRGATAPREEEVNDHDDTN